MDVIAAVIAGVICLIALRVFFVHLDDLYWINIVSGAWLAQANEVLHGNAYPELFDGERVGGTRFMVIPIALNAALAWVLDLAGMARPEALTVAGRLLSLIATSGLVYMIYRLGLRLGAMRGFAALAAAGLLLTSPGQLALHSIRYDAPSAALQLGALLWATSQRPRWLWIGVLLGIAIFCKTNAVWAGLGLTCWLLFTDRRALGRMYLGGTITVAVIALAAHLWSGGRVWENILGLTFSAGDEPKRGAVGSVQAIADYWIRFAKLSGLLLPLSLLGWVTLTGRWREGAPYLLVAFWAVMVAWYSFSDGGVSYNHLLDLLVLVSVGMAAAAGWASRRRWWVDGGAYVMLIFVAMAAVVTGHMTREAIHPGDAYDDLTDEVRVAVDLIPPPDGRPIFAADSFFPIAAGERPQIMDMFMLRRIARRDPSVRQMVIDRIDGHAYRAVVLQETWFESKLVDPKVREMVLSRYQSIDPTQTILVMLPITEDHAEGETP